MLSWHRECKSVNGGCVSHAEGADSRVESGRNKEGSEVEVGFRLKRLEWKKKESAFFFFLAFF